MTPSWHENTSEKALTWPVSPAPLSLTFSVHVPAAAWPSKADSGLFGVNDPDGNAAALPAELHVVSMDGNPPSSSRITCARLLLLHPNADAGTSGRSKKVTAVPAGEVSLKIRSPTHE